LEPSSPISVLANSSSVYCKYTIRCSGIEKSPIQSVR
jgi:hypothetical protein